MRDLVERARAGDREAFSELGRLWVDRLFALAQLILRDPDRAADATQEALVACWRDLRGLRDVDQFESWLRRILVRACYREARRERAQHRIVARVNVLDRVSLDPGPMSVVDRDELERGFVGLTAEQRALLVMHFYLELPVAETAAVLGVPVGTVKSRLHRATAALRATLDAQARSALLAEGRLA
jgi:RNA polymerase sigma-70 factor (ECF subfamily)